MTTNSSGLCGQVREFFQNHPLHLVQPSPNNQLCQRLRILFHTCFEDQYGATFQGEAEGCQGKRRKFRIRFDEFTPLGHLKNDGACAPVQVEHQSVSRNCRLQVRKTNEDCDELLRFLLWTDNTVKVETGQGDTIVSSVFQVACTPTQGGGAEIRVGGGGRCIESYGGQADRPEGQNREYVFWNREGGQGRIIPG